MLLCFSYRTENHAAMLHIRVKSVHLFKAALFSLKDHFKLEEKKQEWARRKLYGIASVLNK